MNEIWKDIKGYEGLYKISNYGRIKKSVRKNKDKRSREYIPEHFIKGTKYSTGYIVVCLCKNGIVKRQSMHRLVASAFIPNPNNFAVVNHIDGNKLNNSVTNLEWLSSVDNVKHAWKTGLVDLEKARLCGKKTIVENSKKRWKSINQYSLDGKLVNQFKNSIEAERITGVSNKHIGSVCKGKRKTTGGFIWKYSESCCGDLE